MSQYEAERLASERGAKVWSGELAVTPKLNTEVATAFPVDQALGELKPGVYVMTATPKERSPTTTASAPRQWFIVSDLGLTAYSGHDGIDVFIHSLATAEPKNGRRRPSDGAQQRSAGEQDHRQSGLVHFEAGLTRGEGGQAPAARRGRTRPTMPSSA